MELSFTEGFALVVIAVLTILVIVQRAAVRMLVMERRILSELDKEGQLTALELIERGIGKPGTIHVYLSRLQDQMFIKSRPLHVAGSYEVPRLMQLVYHRVTQEERRQMEEEKAIVAMDAGREISGGPHSID